MAAKTENSEMLLCLLNTRVQRNKLLIINNKLHEEPMLYETFIMYVTLMQKSVGFSVLLLGIILVSSTVVSSVPEFLQSLQLTSILNLKWQCNTLKKSYW